MSSLLGGEAIKNILVSFWLLILGAVVSSSAAVYCVGPTATNGGSGADWDHLKAWSDTPVRGDTWYLRDSDGTNYSGKTFNTPASGTTLILIKKATPGEHGIATNWNDSLGDGQAVFSGQIYFQTSYWVMDGIKGPTWSTTLTDYGFRFSDGASSGVQLGAVGANLHDVTIRHFAAKATPNDVEKVFCDVNVEASNRTYAVTDNITVGNCLLDGWQVAVRAGGTGGPIMSNWIFEYNVVLNGYNSGANHGEDISNGYGNSLARIVRFNLFRGRTSGTGTVITLNHSSSGDLIYGNVFHSQPGGNGVIGIGSSGYSMTDAKVYNNTFVSCSAAWIGLSQTGYTFTRCEAKNNLLYDMSNIGSSSGWTKDYNAFFKCSGTNGTNVQTGTINPFVDSTNSNYRLSANTTAGTPLPAPYNMDAFGNARTTWTRGAFEFGGTPPPQANPHPADSNSDFLMALNEATKYGACWKNPAAFGDCPSGIAIDYAVRAGTLWAGSATGQYQYNSTNSCPLCWEVKP